MYTDAGCPHMEVGVSRGRVDRAGDLTGEVGVVAAGGAARVSAGVATVVSLICGGWVPQDRGFVARPLSILERGRREVGCSWARRGLVCAGRGRARAASSAATGCGGVLRGVG